MPHRLEDYQEQYERLFKDCRIVEAAKQQQVEKVVAAIQAHQARYAALADRLGLPWYFAAAVHQREASGNFSHSIRDGHRLPAGLGWEDDALAVLQEQCGGWHNWTLPGLLYRLEAYNGFGYRQYQINSPYLWSFASCYTRGKYVGDGRFDPAKVDEQPGTAVMLHRLAAQGLITIPGATVSPAAPVPQSPAIPFSGRTYVVQSGDTLSAVAAAFGLGWRDLWQANRAMVPNPDIVHPGQELLIPVAASSGKPGTTPPKPSPQTTVNIVKAGEVMPRWLLIARQEVGIHENSAPRQDNPRIIEYLKSTSYDGELTDEVKWCSAFVNWCITQAGLKGTGSAAASSWLTWGKKLTQPRLGCIVVFNHHVGFYTGAAGNHFLLLGGNQSNAVNKENKSPSEVLAYRWPSNA